MMIGLNLIQGPSRIVLGGSGHPLVIEDHHRSLIAITADQEIEIDTIGVGMTAVNVVAIIESIEEVATIEVIEGSTIEEETIEEGIIEITIVNIENTETIGVAKETKGVVEMIVVEETTVMRGTIVAEIDMVMRGQERMPGLTTLS